MAGEHTCPDQPQLRVADRIPTWWHAHPASHPLGTPRPDRATLRRRLIRLVLERAVRHRHGTRVHLTFIPSAPDQRPCLSAAHGTMLGSGRYSSGGDRGVDL